MTLVEQPVELTSPPPNLKPKLGIDGRENESQLRDRYRVDLAALDPRYQVLTHACPTSHVVLAPSEVLAKGSDGPA